MASQILVCLLGINSAYVAVLLAHKRNAWGWIVCYWVILTAKNLMEAMGV